MSELRADDPRQLGSYRLTRRLGQGGQGIVYLGESPQGAPVAVKLLHASLSRDPDARRRFLGEVEAVRKVAAFCTAQLLDADLEGDRLYLVSEYVEGPSLRELIVEEGPRQGGSLERLAIGTATALGAIHRAGVVHRDFKPGNVLLGIDGPRVIDFGVSRLVDTAVTTSHMPMGTPAYMAPERMKAEPAGPPADMWAWGLTVVYTATGRNAYTADTHQEVLARVLYGKPDLGSLEGRLRGIVQACLAAEPLERPNAEEVLRQLLGQDAGGVDVLSTGAMVAIGKSYGTTSRRDAASLRSVVGLGASEAEPGVITDPDPTTSFPAITAPLIAARAEASKAASSAASSASSSSEGGSQPAAGTTVEPRTGTTAPIAPAEIEIETETPARRRFRPWQLAVLAVGLAAAVAGFLYWQRGAEGPVLEGAWTGSAEHFTADRVFPITLTLDADGGGKMRWGADLHCTGRLARNGGGMVFTLDRVKGEECYPGTVQMIPASSDANQMDIKVTREGKNEVTYSGKVSRPS
ncbi:serine/threonine-protein kinase [Nonomuraea sp. NPDC050404]|uniref:serine/threonine-protein kinase n=1 Tax=Nonomuraea sp. NPDC050404 TaxID=3155783 RepID=UPI0033FBBC8E